MTAIELIQTVQDLISEETYARFTKAEILRWLNRGLEDIAIKTGYLTSTWPKNTADDDREYAYPDGALRLYRIVYDNEQLSPCDIPTLDEATEETGTKWLAETGAPTNWYHSYNRYYGIYPTPDGIYALTLYGFAKATVLSDDAHTPSIPDQFHTAPALFAAYQILREDKELITAASLRNEYYKPATRTGIIFNMIKEKRKMKHIASGRTIKLARWSS